jgi:hypothetical protein
MALYRVFLAKEIAAQLKDCKRREREAMTRFFDELANDPYRAGEFVELDDISREIQATLIGRHAVYFWSDHAVKEVKVIGMKVADH